MPHGTWQVPERGEERLLDRVGGLVAVGHHARDEREQVILVALDEVVERGEIAGARASMRIRSRRWIGSSNPPRASGRSSTGRAALPTAMARRGESSIGLALRRRPSGPWVPMVSVIEVGAGAVRRRRSEDLAGSSECGPKWRNGRRGGLKHRWGQGHPGSSPGSGTTPS